MYDGYGPHRPDVLHTHVWRITGLQNERSLRFAFMECSECTALLLSPGVPIVDLPHEQSSPPMGSEWLGDIDPKNPWGQ